MNKIIAVVGMSGSGKSFACQILTNKGYKSVYFGGVIYQKMKEEGIEITPDSQKEFREKLRREQGMGVIAKILLKDITKLYETENVVLDGLYSWDEYKILKEKFQELKLIAIITDKKLRYERVGKREERPFSNKDIIKRDIAEIENSAKGGPIAYADYFVLNNGTKEEYEDQLNRIIEKIEKEV